MGELLNCRRARDRRGTARARIRQRRGRALPRGADLGQHRRRVAVRRPRGSSSRARSAAADPPPAPAHRRAGREQATAGLLGRRGARRRRVPGPARVLPPRLGSVPERVRAPGQRSARLTAAYTRKLQNAWLRSARAACILAPQGSRVAFRNASASRREAAADAPIAPLSVPDSAGPAAGHDVSIQIPAIYRSGRVTTENDRRYDPPESEVGAPAPSTAGDAGDPQHQ